MKAWVLDSIGKFNLKEVTKAQASNEHVLIKVHAAGICGSDIQRVYENGAHKMPIILGHEFAGQVESVGKDVDSAWIGKRVGVFPLMPCMKCPSCLEKKYEMCTSYNYLGSRTDGGFAEYVSVPKWNLIELPDEVSYEQAAMLEPMAVAVHAMRRLDICKENTVVVDGLGTIGQLLVMFLLERGIDNIYAIGNSDSQKVSVISLGLTEDRYCNSNEIDVVEYIKLATNGAGTNVYFDCVGKNETIDIGLEATAAGGQVCIIGNPYSDMKFSKTTWWKILRQQLRITGTWNSSFLGEEDGASYMDDWHYVLERLRDGRVSPKKLITHRFDIEELGKGFELMRDKKEPYTKVLMTN